MDTTRQLVRAVAGIGVVSVQGRYYRFTTQKRVDSALNGSTHGGRWGPPGAFPVLYLTDSYEGCVIEAYRHATDPSDEPLPPPKLALISCDVAVDNVLDLTTAAARMALGLDPSILHSEPQGPDGAAYSACSAIALAAHQLERRGVLVPSATHKGTTLALFTDLLGEAEQPQRVGAATEWDDLPPDPRQLRLVVSDGVVRD